MGSVAYRAKGEERYQGKPLMQPKFRQDNREIIQVAEKPASVQVAD
jgi:hypothetical protein